MTRVLNFHVYNITTFFYKVKKVGYLLKAILMFKKTGASDFGVCQLNL